MEAVDILFPWRKRPSPQSQQQPQKQAPPSSPSVSKSTTGPSSYSLPHPNVMLYNYTSESARMFDTSTAGGTSMSRRRTSDVTQNDDEGTFVGDRRAILRNAKQSSFNSQSQQHTGTMYNDTTTIGTADNYRQQQQQQPPYEGTDDLISTYSMEMSTDKQYMQSRQQPSRRLPPRGMDGSDRGGNNSSFISASSLPKYRGGGGGGGGGLDYSNRSALSDRSGGSGPYYQNQYGPSSSQGGGYSHPRQQRQHQQQVGGSMRRNSHIIEEDDEYYNDQEEDDDLIIDDERESLPISPYRQLIDAINMSILPTSLRLSSLAQACEFFDHRDKSIHDAELREGAAFVLYHKLAFVLRLSRCGEIDGEMEERAKLMMEGSSVGVGGGGTTKDNVHLNHLLGGGGGSSSSGRNMMMTMNHQHTYQRHLANSTQLQKQSEHDKEIAMICSCLEMIHRANPDAIAQTWDECGVEILPLLVSVLERPFQKIERAVWNALYNQNVSGGGGCGGGVGGGGANNVPGSLERAVAMAVTRDQKLAVQKVTKVLAMYSLVPEAKSPMCQCEGMLRWLTRIIDTHNYNRVKPGTPAFGGRASFRGAGNSASGVGGGGSTLRGSFNSMLSEEAKKDSAKRLELASRATSGSGLYMTEAARFNTIATLTNLAALESNRMPMLLEPGLLDNICRAVHNEHSDVPKQCSALAIMNLSNGDMDNVPEMASNDMVLETLLKLIREVNPETRRNAVVTIFNIACSDLNTVRLARYRDGMILEALTELVGSDDPVRLHDEARANAAETLFNMACSDISETTDRMANHAGLLECLAVVLRGEHTGLEVKMYCSATLRRMAELIRHPMIAQGALLSALVKAATWTSTDCIAEAFKAQASEPENCVIVAHHHGLLNALSRLALTSGDDADVDKVRRAAVGAIELMSRQDEARALLARNEGIIMALTKASYGDEGSLKDESLTRQSMMSEMDEATFDQSYGRFEGDEDEEASVQSRRIQLALKNLVSAM
ncbi:hypothetical protein ACHAWT_001621 [Skeletonema menzelii]